MTERRKQLLKKILFFLFLSSLCFSNTCNWVSEPNQTLKKYIGVIKKHNLTSKVYCDNNDTLMAYWRSNDENDIDIGLMLNDINAKSLSLDEAVNAFNTFVKKVGIFDEVKLNRRKGDLIPENVNIRLYMYNSDYEDTYMLYKIVYNFTNDTISYYYNEKYFSHYSGFIDEVRKMENFYPTNDIIY
jgi:hypothetical protein